MLPVWSRFGRIQNIAAQGRTPNVRCAAQGHTRFSNWANLLANTAWALDTGDGGSILGQVPTAPAPTETL